MPTQWSGGAAEADGAEASDDRGEERQAEKEPWYWRFMSFLSRMVIDAPCYRCFYWQSAVFADSGVLRCSVSEGRCSIVARLQE